MKLVTIGTSAIDAECEIAKKELTVLHERCVASNQQIGRASCRERVS